MEGVSQERELERVLVASPAARRSGDVAAALGLAALGFLVVGFLQRAAVPDDALLNDEQRGKLADWRERSAEIDVVFFGSSLIHSGLVPEVVDARLGELGHPLRSFNLGMTAGFSFETDAFLRRVLPSRAARLRYAVIELPDWGLESRNLDSLRSVTWHDAHETHNVLSALAGNAAGFERLTLAAEHVRLFTMRTASVGIGPVAVGEVLALRAPELAPGSGPGAASRGFAEAQELEGAASRRAQFERQVKLFERDVSELCAGGGPAMGPARYPLEALRRQIAFLRGQGLEIVYVMTPIPFRTPWAEELVRQGEIPALLAFNDPLRYPELFTVQNRFDKRHLAAEGARAFSRRFAEAFAERLEQGEHEAVPR